jgi:benzoate transport
MMLISDPKNAFSNVAMRWPQVVVIGITMALTGLDGFDVLAISFASPGISAEWHISRAALGVVLSMELIGMSIGSIALGRLADYIGRRPTLLLCLVAMATGMFGATFAPNTTVLSLWRLFTGLGIGGTLATANAVAAEFSSFARRELSVSLMAIGYPIGATLGGAMAAILLRNHNWRSVFYLGCTMTAGIIPLVFAFVPESVHWLCTMQPKQALKRVNVTLAKMRHDLVMSLPQANGAGLSPLHQPGLFSPPLRYFTALSTLAYAFHIFTFYYILKWLPTIVVDQGFPASAAASVLVWTNVGGFLGGGVFGFFAKTVGVKRLSTIAMLVSSIMVVIVGDTSGNLDVLSLICAIAGFSIAAANVGLYGIFARGFPTEVRASGTGFGIGIGRGGAVLAPIAAGLLFRDGVGVAVLSGVMALGSLAAAAVVLILRFPRGAR